MAPRREAFITIGATASFLPLIENSLSQSFISTLSALEYTHLTIQCGPDLSHAISKADKVGKRLAGKEPRRSLHSRDERWESSRPSEWWEIYGVKTRLFDFNKEGLGSEMRNCKATNVNTVRHGEEERREGLVVSHAGAGTILDAMRLDLPIIVVPNPSLLDNHQVELAEELERQGYVTYGQLNDLPFAVLTSEAKSQERKSWQPENVPNSADPYGQGIIGVMDEEVGYELRAREVLD